MSRIIKLKTLKFLIDKSNRKPPSGDKCFGLDPDIHLYEIEDGDKTEKGRESKTLIVQN